MAIEVTERRMDEKRRVTIPSLVELKAGSKVVVIASADSAIIAPDMEIAESLAKLLRDLEARKKQVALDEWESLIAEAGLADVSSKEIDNAVAKGIKRRSDRLDENDLTGSR